MKKILFISFICLPFLAFAQRFQVNGTVVDTSKNPIVGATVLVLEAKDSTLAGFVQTDEKGFFEIKDLKGNYVLKISSVSYLTHNQFITIEKSQKLSEITLKTDYKILQEVSVKAEAIPIKLQKDTIEYGAAYFKTPAGSMVEDLLKKLPGVEVAADGTIKSHGKEVKSILVDGEEFFGKDPKVATKNLPADIVDKVQVFNKRSEQAEFSNVDDGNDERTINIKLRPDKKHGYFGNAEAGIGTSERYNAKANFNRFSKTTQISFIGLANNINAEGFSSGDYLRNMGGMNAGNGTSTRISLDGNNGGTGNNQNGIINTKAGGLNFNRRWSKKTRLSSNYFVNTLQQDNAQKTLKQSFINNQTITNRDTQLTNNQSLNQRLNLSFRHSLDSLQDIRLQFNGNLSTADAIQNVVKNVSSQSLATSKSLQNYDSKGTQYNWKSDIIYRRKVGKKGSTFSLNGVWGQSNNSKNSDIFAYNSFSQLDKTDTLLQTQTNLEKELQFKFNGNYTHSLGNQRLLQIYASRQNTTNNTNKNYYDLQSENDENGILNNNLSNQVNRGFIYDKAGLMLQRNTKMVKFSTGIALQHTQLKSDLINNTPYRAAFLSLLPSFRYKKDIKASNFYEITYNTNINAPSVEDLQPLVNNSDPLNIRVGNPALKPAYSHRLNFDYMKFNQFAMQNFFIDLSSTFTSNKIAYSRTIDSSLRQIIKPINVANDFTSSAFMNFSAPLSFIKSKFNLNTNLAYNRSLQPVNENILVANNYTSSFDITFENKKKEHLDLQIGGGLDFNKSVFEQQESKNRQYLNQNYFTDITYKFNKKLSVKTAFNYQIYTTASIGNQQVVPLWTANATYYFLKDNKMKVVISAYDLLNRNVGIDRSSSANYVQEVRNSVVGRYVMLTLGYNISGFGKQEDGGIKIDRRGRN